jgi:DNA mismatch endonuclease (patch repair protein)
MLPTSPERSKNMRAIRSKNTSPEVLVRKALHRRGLRFRLHRKDLPGTPDITLPKMRLVIFVNGCFWHQHPQCKRATIPVTNQEFWKKKFQSNLARDEEARSALESSGWHVATVWECETKSVEKINNALDQILSLLHSGNKS